MVNPPSQVKSNEVCRLCAWSMMTCRGLVTTLATLILLISVFLFIMLDSQSKAWKLMSLLTVQNLTGADGPLYSSISQIFPSIPAIPWLTRLTSPTALFSLHHQPWFPLITTLPHMETTALHRPGYKQTTCRRHHLHDYWQPWPDCSC